MQTSWLVQPHGWSSIISFHFVVQWSDPSWHLDSKQVFFLICNCEFYSGKDSTKINKNKVKCLPTLIKSFVLKHGSHVNLKITVLKINNSNAHVGSTFCEGKLL